MLRRSNMKIIRKGNKKGLDVDYQVNVETPEDVEKLHQQLLNKGLLFTYATGDIPYQKFDSNVVLHYIDKSFNVYDYAIIFTPQAKKDKQRKTLEEEYQRSKTDPEYKTYFMKYMKHHKTITAFKKHMKAYGEPLQGPYKTLFESFVKNINTSIIEIDVPEMTIEGLRKFDSQLKDLLLPK
jgi:hypothetical protein